MKNYQQKGENLTFPAPYAVESGGGVKIGNIFGVAAESVAQNVLVDIVTEGVFVMDKVAAQGVGVGEYLYWDDAAKLITTTSVGNTKVGVAIAASAIGAGVATVRLNGAF